MNLHPLSYGDIELSYEMSEQAFRFSVVGKDHKGIPSSEFNKHLEHWIGRYHRLNEDFVEKILDDINVEQAAVLYLKTRRESSKVFLRMKWGFDEAISSNQTAV